MSRPLTIDKTKLLIVEGRDEEFFFDALLKVHLHKTDVQILPIGGKTQLGNNLQALVRDPNYPTVETLVVVRDADLTPPNSSTPASQSAWDSVISAMRSASIPTPPAPAHFSDGPPRTGIFIVPDGTNDGMLETLCLAAVRNQPEFPCVDEYFQCLATHNVQPGNEDKARAHAYLASRPRPDLRVGEAAKAGYWPWDADAFTSLIDFVDQL